MDLRAAAHRLPVDRALDAEMASHYGLIAHSRALELGATARLVQRRTDGGLWVPMHRTVYRSAAVPRSDEQELLAAVLASGEMAVASHRSAAWLWQFLAAPPSLPEVTVPVTRSVRHRDITLHRSTDLVGAPVVLRRGIPATDPTRTVLDAVGVLGPNAANLVVDRAIARKLTTVDQLLAALDRYGRRGRRGAGRLRAVLSERGVASSSHAPTVLESAMARLILLAGIAPPIAEYIVANGLFRFDFAWPEIRVAAEVDGWDGHSAFADWQRNIDKQNWASANDWVVMHFTWDDVKNHPERTAQLLLDVIRRRRLDGDN